MPSSSRRRRGLFILMALLILAVLPAGYLVFLGEPPLPPPPPAPEVAAPIRPLELRIHELSGRVEVRRAGGEWTQAQQGEALQAAESVRTQAGSYAVLVGGTEVEVRMEPGTEISVDQLTDSISRVLLGAGMASAKVRGKGRHTFEVKAAGSDAVARTGDGAFTMSNDGKGTVAVGTREGEVAFLGRGKMVIVRAGQQSISRPGQAPSEPTPVPQSLLLKVQWPTAGTELRVRKTVIQGRVEPGTRIELADQVFSPGPDGRFERTVRLKEGKNDVSVKVRSVGGVSREEREQIRVDTTHPPVIIDDLPWKR